MDSGLDASRRPGMTAPARRRLGFAWSVIVAAAAGEQHETVHSRRRKLHQLIELRLGQWRRQVLQVYGVGGNPLEPGDRVGIERLPGIEVVARALRLRGRNSEPIGIDLERGVISVERTRG